MKFKLFISFFLLLIWSSFLSGNLYADNDVEHSAAVKIYQKFANAFMSGRFAEARSLSYGDASIVVDRKEELVRSGEKLLPIQEPLFMIVSENPSQDGGEVWLHAVQVVQVDTEEGMFKPPTLHRQYVTLQKKKEGWKVVSFKDDKEKCCTE
ncbi:MAG: hypothetical protein HQL68_06050 [Magnetococcales bacterium]|nr:hypothetical protein [Magnetococcales bacterium]